jgi:GT2 family glycosyltransferase
MKRVYLVAILLFNHIVFPAISIDHCVEKKPRVSMITSLYKGDDFIAGFLSDIVRQTIFDQCELIIINANSPGREEPIIKEYMQRYPNIVYKKLDYDPGLYAVWNMAIKMARSEFITNANVDDRRNPESLAMQVDALDADPSIDLVYLDYRITYTPNETFENNTGEAVVFPHDFAPHFMYKCLPGPQPMWRKSMHFKVGFFDESFKCSGDFEMWNRAVSKGCQFKKLYGFSGLFYHNPKGLSTDAEKKSTQNLEMERIVNSYQTMWLTQRQYYCTAANKDYYKILLNLIGSIHENNFDKVGGIAVFDLGLTEDQIETLNAIDKVSVHKIELTHPDLLTYFKTSHAGRLTPGWYAWKFVVLKQSLELFPYVLWVDAGTTVLKPLDDLFKYIDQTGYFLCTMGDKVDNKLAHDIRWGATQHVKEAFNLEAPIRSYILAKEPIESGIIGVSRKAMEYMVMPLYEFSKNLSLFADDGTSPNGFGAGRHDQTVLSVFAYLHGLTIYEQDHRQHTPMYLNVDSQNKELYITWDGNYMTDKTCLYHSRGHMINYDRYYNAIHWK